MGKWGNGSGEMAMKNLFVIVKRMGIGDGMGISAGIWVGLAVLLCTSPVVFAQRGAVGQFRGNGDGPSEWDGESIVVNSDLVKMAVTVTDAQGRHIDGLQKNAFSVFDNKSQQLISFLDDSDEPVSVAVVFD